MTPEQRRAYIVLIDNLIHGGYAQFKGVDFRPDGGLMFHFANDHTQVDYR